MRDFGVDCKPQWVSPLWNRVAWRVKNLRESLDEPKEELAEWSRVPVFWEYLREFERKWETFEGKSKWPNEGMWGAIRVGLF